MFLSLYSHPGGVQVDAGLHVTYDLQADAAHLGACAVSGPALRWTLAAGTDTDALLSVELALPTAQAWLIRCDRVDFPAGSVAHRHTHPGPGIRCMLFGALTVEAGGHRVTHGPLGAWFERGPDPVLATAAVAGPSAFVRVMLLPAEWAGQRTIRYVDPAAAAAPRRQSARVYLDEPVSL